MWPIEPYPEFEDAVGQLAAAIRSARRATGIMYISPYMRGTMCRPNLVAAGVHKHIRAQIPGRVITEMSRVYTELPQESLIEAIYKLPRPMLWSEAEIVKNPWKVIVGRS